MEHYEGILIPKKENKNRNRAIIGVIVLLVGGVSVFFITTARGKTFFKNTAAIFSASFEDALGIARDRGVEEIGLNASSGSIFAESNSTSVKNKQNQKTAPAKKKSKSVLLSTENSSSQQKITAPGIIQKNASSVSTTVIATSSSSSASGSILKNAPLVASSSFHQPSSTAQVYRVEISLSGDGRGIVTSSPPGLSCGMTCIWSFPAGQTVKLHATADTASSFGGWSGACSGISKDCIFVPAGYVSITVNFRALTEAVIPIAPVATTAQPAAPIVDGTPASLQSPVSTDTPASSDATGPSSAPILNGVDHVLIAAVQIAGQSSANDFVKIFNPTPSPIDISGWKLHKHSSTGTDYSLKEFPKGVVIQPQGYLVWASSVDGFSATIGADFSTSETLSSDNSVALLDASNTIIDAVAWGNGVGQYGEGPAYPVNPAANQVLSRLSEDGTMVDTDDNAADFSLQ